MWLLALGLAAFATGTDDMVIAGILPEVSAFTQNLSQTEVCDHVLELYRARIATVGAHLEAANDTRDRLTAELASLEERAAD